jgi:2-oxoglutarate dehydrogenase E1 component
MIYPLPADALSAILAASPDSDLVLVQEEPENMGVWSWTRPRLEDLAEAAGHRKPKLRYVGRPESSSPAGSFHGHHDADQSAIVAAAHSVEASQQLAASAANSGPTKSWRYAW